MLGIDDAALAIMFAGLASSAGSLYSNARNLKNQNKVNDINWNIAAQNNATQIEMANTAHQREVADLRAAGLNPILSAGGSGAVTPNLTSPRGEAARIENPAEGLATSARQLGQYVSEQYKKQNAILDNQKSILDLEAAKSDLENQAISEMMTTRNLEFDKKSGHYMIVPHFNDHNSEYFKALKKGLLEDAKIGANAQLWKAAELAPSFINSAGSLIRGGKKR